MQRRTFLSISSLLLFAVVHHVNAGGPPTSATVEATSRAVFDIVDVDLDPGEIVFVEINYDTYAPLFIFTTGTFDTEIGVYDAEGTLIAENDSGFGSGINSQITLSDLIVGTYYLAVGIDDVTFGPDFDAQSNSTSKASFDLRIGTLPFHGEVAKKLNRNFNGIVHAGEGNDPDDPDGFRSISDRALDFRDGFPANPLLSMYGVESQAGELDILHLGNRNVVASGALAFDKTVDGDCIGVQPNWLENPDQTMSPISVVSDYEFISYFSHLGILYQIDGGGSFDVIVKFCFTDFEFRTTVSGPNWLGGEPNIGFFLGATDADCATPDPDGNDSLTISEVLIDLTEAIENTGIELVPRSISFELSEGNLNSVAILGATIGFAGVYDIFDQGDFNSDGAVDALDIAPFVEILVSGEQDLRADINRDCLVNLGDVDPFIQLLIGG